MRLQSLKTLAALAALTLTLSGCGTAHYIQNSGQTLITLGREKIKGMAPNPKGELSPGEIQLQPGALIILPKTEQEVIDALKKAGAIFPGGK